MHSPRACWLPELRIFEVSMFKPTLLAACLISGVISFASPSLALTIQEVPNPRQVNNGWVTDMADVLSPATELEINRLITALEAQNGSEIAVVTVPEIPASITPKAFTTALFNHWGIGKRGQENGVLFLISIGDRRTEIETGYGVEGILPDARVGRILDQHVVPQFRAGNYDGGILAGTQALVTALEAETTYNPVVTPVMETPWYVRVLMVGGIAVGAIAFRLVGITARRPVAVAPEGYFRQWSDSHDQVVETYTLVGSLSIVSTVLLLLKIVADLDLIAVLISGTAGTFILYLLLSQLVLKWKSDRRSIRPLCCEVCQHPLEKLPDPSVYPLLNSVEQTAHKLGSVFFEGWRCSHCYPEKPVSDPNRVTRDIPKGWHLRAYELGGQYQLCAHCNENTVEKTSTTLVHATERHTGRRLITLKCKCCSYHDEREEIIPRITSSSSSGGSGGSSGGGSSGGGSFGGGSSGGGGAGRSW